MSDSEYEQEEEREEGDGAEDINENQTADSGDHSTLPSLRGAPAHMRDEIRRIQNAEYSRRSRQRRREELEELMEQHNEQITQIKDLEDRVAALVRILEAAGIAVPEDTVNSVRFNLHDEHELASNERLFAEFARLLNDSAGGSAQHSSRTEN